MIKNWAIFIILLITLVQVSFSASLNALNKQCLCDISDQCDSECCCDTSCDALLITKWQSYKLCVDDSFGIPFCSKLTQTDVNILDLHSGLRTIYSVIKRLFCITSVNFVQPQDWFKKSVDQSDLDNQISSLLITQSQQITNADLLAETQFTVNGLPLKKSNGLCKPSTKLTKNMNKKSSCRVYVTIAADVLTSMLSIQNIQSSLGVSLNKYSTKSISTGTIVGQTLTTQCVTTSCINVVRQVKIFINLNDGSIVNSISLLVVGPMNVDQAGYITVDYEYIFIKVENNQPIFPFSSKIGYQIGSPINLLFKDSANEYYKIFTPFNLAFRRPDGKCRTSIADDAANSFIDMKFGYNQVISCLGSINLIYENLRQVFNYVGKYGVSSDKLSSYTAITLPPNSALSSESVQLIIYYINIGIPQNPQYQISKVELRPVTSRDGLSTLYIEFISVENKFNLYVPPAPTVDAYLPNDFLYPFFVA